jgi:hypothetical protein
VLNLIYPVEYIVGMAASIFMIVYWFLRVRPETAKKGWKLTSYLGELPWITTFFVSAQGIMKELASLYLASILAWISLVAIIIGLIIDGLTMSKRLHKNSCDAR